MSGTAAPEFDTSIFTLNVVSGLKGVIAALPEMSISNSPASRLDGVLVVKKVVIQTCSAAVETELLMLRTAVNGQC